MDCYKRTIYTVGVAKTLNGKRNGKGNGTVNGKCHITFINNKTGIKQDVL